MPDYDLNTMIIDQSSSKHIRLMIFPFILKDFDDFRKVLCFSPRCDIFSIFTDLLCGLKSPKSPYPERIIG